MENRQKRLKYLVDERNYRYDREIFLYLEKIEEIEEMERNLEHILERKEMIRRLEEEEEEDF